MGELAGIPRVLDHTGTLKEIAEKYDRILEAIEYGALDEVKETDLLAALLVQRALRDKLQIDEPRLIADARRRNITWSRIAPALEVRSRQAAERRYLQLRQDIDGMVGHPLTQSDRVEVARTQRDRKAEQRWATEHSSEIIDLASRLAAVPELQQRADSCPKVTRANKVAALHARRNGERDPAPVHIPWPARLIETVAAEEAHREAEAAARQHAEDLFHEDPGPTLALLTPVKYARLIHQMFSLVGYAVDSDNVDLTDHQSLVDAIRELYARAGSDAPRAPEDY
ncbi:hypothetical protein ACFRIC_39220 [Streptomyces sp. NPDC056738]|uniref:hypothetical protein n=1 Tax=Streptomyces sp. NPDC056738 TaxID=3345933 RepID=UPI0036AB7FE1